MVNLNEYLENMNEKVESISRNRESKVEGVIVELVNELIGKNEPTTIKTIATTLNKRPQHIHQVISKSTKLGREKIKGVTLIVPKQ